MTDEQKEIIARLLDEIEDRSGDSQGFGSADAFAIENAVDSIRMELGLRA